jgi:hypothetical protein
MKDRADSGRGRPWNKESLERVAKMEEEYPVKLGEPKIAEIIYICPDTKQTTYLHYPDIYKPREALVRALQIDRRQGHRHHPWETWEIS